MGEGRDMAVGLHGKNGHMLPKCQWHDPRQGGGLPAAARSRSALVAPVGSRARMGRQRLIPLSTAGKDRGEELERQVEVESN